MANHLSTALLSLALLSFGCSDDGGAPDTGTTDTGVLDTGRMDTSTDAPVDSTTPLCTDDPSCDDGNPCNGTETCDPAGAGCAAGAPLANGDECDADSMASTTDHCIDGVCTPSICGDGIVDDATSEECDDANDVDGDGCDFCLFSCNADTECDDLAPCNGVETCGMSTHACADGTPLADGTACAGATGTCTTGTCVPNSCTADGDCDDGSFCSGVETCVSDACVPATPVDCDDSIACTDDTCDDGRSACVHRLIDADGDGHPPASLGACGDDCADDDDTVYAGAPDFCDGKDNDCDGSTDEGVDTTWYADCDGDGYAAMTAVSITGCVEPIPSLTSCATGGAWTVTAPADITTADCNDANAAVNPGQTTPQVAPIPGAPVESDYDYDCDGSEDPSFGGAGMCVLIGCPVCMSPPCEICMRSCRGGNGYSGTPPECGTSGSYFTCGGTDCTATTMARTQSCL